MDAIDRRKRITEEAAQWCVVLQGGDVSRAQREQYVDWLRESSVHIAEMLHIAQVHGALEQFERWSVIPIDGSREAQDNVITLAAVPRQAEAQRGIRESGGRSRLIWGMAAIVLVLTGISTLLLLRPSGDIIQTERGERREMALADGSVVQVDPETLLRIEYAEHTRRVFLERGRALFHVAKNAARPFLVEANNSTVRAVGTAFAVERQSQSIVVTVAEGKVAVFPSHSLLAAAGTEGSAQAPSKRTADASLGGTSASSSRIDPVAAGTHLAPPESVNGAPPEIFLTANQQVTVLRSGSAEPVHAINSDRALAWAEGRLVFENTSVGDAVQQFNRYNRVQLVINDADLARRPISGVFSAADPESFAAFIQSVAHVRIITRSDGPDITFDTAQ